MRALVGVAGSLAFSGFVAVQLNDPDPVRWVAVYGFAAVLGVAHALNRAPRTPALLYAGFCVGWALSLAPAGLHAPPKAIVTDLAMHAPGVEEAREALGLLLAGVWAAFVGWSRALPTVEP